MSKAAKPWAPEKCPITQRPFFMWIEHHKTGEMVPTYGGPYDSYTLAEFDGEDFVCERFDHDAGGWLIDCMEGLGVKLVDDQSLVINPNNTRYDEIEAFAAAPVAAQAQPSGDREMLLELMAAFDGETHECEHCGHGEPTLDMDSAHRLREYLANNPVPAQQPVSGADGFPEIMQPIETIKYWADAYANPEGDEHFMGHGMVVTLLREYAALRTALAQQAGTTGKLDQFRDAAQMIEPSENSGELDEDDSIALDRLADYIADTWPMDKKYSLEEICQRLHVMWPGEFIAIEDLRKNDPNLREAVRALLIHWQRFQKSDGNQQDAYNLLVKGAKMAWKFAEDELSRSESPDAQVQTLAQQDADKVDVSEAYQRGLRDGRREGDDFIKGCLA